MKRLIFVLLLTGCSYTKSEIDTKFLNITNKMRALAGQQDLVNNQLFPEAMKVAKEKKCAVDVKTNKCLTK